jgi:peptidoglycan-N-acetylglucosamine deacetylase
MYLPKTPNIAKNVFPRLLWSKDGKEKEIYLTFDDGPTPGVTEWVLEQLDAFNAKASFFCVGKNVELFPELFASILEKGHAVGNHTYSHLNAWKTPVKDYLMDIAGCEATFHSELFRPPYGKLRPRIRRKVLEQFNIVMWDVLSYDFDVNLNGEDCFQNVKKYSKPGSIVVFHDSIKAESRLKVALPKCLDFFAEQGFQFKAL